MPAQTGATNEILLLSFSWFVSTLKLSNIFSDSAMVRMAAEKVLPPGLNQQRQSVEQTASVNLKYPEQI
jgi:hypothetical protein